MSRSMVEITLFGRGGRAPALTLVGAALTDPGRVRTSNEDAVLARPDARLWAVADGMGGHEDGEWASDAIVRALAGLAVTGDFEADCQGVARTLQAANSVIHQRAETHRTKMGSTVVALLVGDDRLAVFWAGDSRAYRLRGRRLEPLTTDHTHVQAKVARGLMTPAEARAHPLAHILSRAVGAEAALDLAEMRWDAAPGDIFMLCSDGLHGVVLEAQIGPILAQSGPAEACEALVALCHAEGAPDNVSVVVVAAG